MWIRFYSYVIPGVEKMWQFPRTLSSGSRNADYSPRMNKGSGGKGGEASDPKYTKCVYPKAYVTNPPLVREHSPEDEEQEKGLINKNTHHLQLSDGTTVPREYVEQTTLKEFGFLRPVGPTDADD